MTTEDDPPITTRIMLDNATPHLHTAVEYMIKCWDAIYEAEKILGFEITTMEISDLAIGIDHADDVRRLLKTAYIKEWIDSVRTAWK